MGLRHSTYADTVGIGGRESDTSSPDCFMIEPVPEGLEHVVYPKYEEAFRLGLEAFSNPMRVNKFKRPLPFILGTTQFHKQPRAGIVPASKLSCSSGMPSPRKSHYSQPPSTDQANDQVDSYLSSTQAGIIVYEDETMHDEHHDPEVALEDEKDKKGNEEHNTVFYRNSDRRGGNGGSPSIDIHSDPFMPPLVPTLDDPARPETEIDDVRSSSSQQVKLDQSYSISQLDGGLFDSDVALTDALDDYRRHEESSKKQSYGSDDTQSLLPDASLVSIRQQQSSTRVQGERSQASKDLQQLGKSLSDLKMHRATGNKSNS